MTSSVADWLRDVLDVLGQHNDSAPIGDQQRRAIVDALGRSGAAHRERVRAGTGLDAVDMTSADVRRLCVVANNHLDRTIRSARRDDGLYHSYNRVAFPTDSTAAVDHLGPMLEGQVAVLSAQTLGADEALAILDALFASDMYRADQNTFMLYPATKLPPFLDRNCVPAGAAERIGAPESIDGSLRRIFTIDHEGQLRFRPEVVNAAVLQSLVDQEPVPDSVRMAVLDIYEEVFDHRSFTGRSSSMYGYEGLGSVYWHMVAKLLLAVQEIYWNAIDDGEPDDVVARLADAYRRVRSGLGFQKDPASYGAIPTDCYSHTPGQAGAQQPGMTGQVKEEVLTRFGELGFRVVDGCALLAPGLLPPGDILAARPDGDIDPARFSMCGVPMTIAAGPDDMVTIRRADGSKERSPGLVLTPASSRELFARSGGIAQIDWVLGDDTMDRWKMNE